jgi:hypothetical protein
VPADSEGFVEEATVDDAPSDSIREDAFSDGVGVGVDVSEACRETFSCVVEAAESSGGLSSCRRKAAWGAATVDCRQTSSARHIKIKRYEKRMAGGTQRRACLAAADNCHETITITVSERLQIKKLDSRENTQTGKCAALECVCRQ